MERAAAAAAEKTGAPDFCSEFTMDLMRRILRRNFFYLYERHCMKCLLFHCVEAPTDQNPTWNLKVVAGCITTFKGENRMRNLPAK